MATKEQTVGDTAKKLLKENKVELVIGYSRGSSDSRTRPFFVTEPEDASKLVWDKHCRNNLTVYLPEHKDNRVGIFVKGCDSRALVELVKAKQINRENLVVIGLPCEGVVDEDDKLYQKCVECRVRNPLDCDMIIGSEVKEQKVEGYLELEELDNMSPEERKQYWLNAFDRCIKCMACRNVCPVCFCNECILNDKELVPDARESRWMMHLIKAYHNTGLCCDCGECKRACPMNLPLRKLYLKMHEEVERLFGYRSGSEDPAPFTTFKAEEELK